MARGLADAGRGHLHRGTGVAGQGRSDCMGARGRGPFPAVPVVQAKGAEKGGRAARLEAEGCCGPLTGTGPLGGLTAGTGRAESTPGRSAWVAGFPKLMTEWRTPSDGACRVIPDPGRGCEITTSEAVFAKSHGAALNAPTAVPDPAGKVGVADSRRYARRPDAVLRGLLPAGFGADRAGGGRAFAARQVGAKGSLRRSQLPPVDAVVGDGWFARGL